MQIEAEFGFPEWSGPVHMEISLPDIRGGTVHAHCHLHGGHLHIHVKPIDWFTLVVHRHFQTHIALNEPEYFGLN